MIINGFPESRNLNYVHIVSGESNMENNFECVLCKDSFTGFGNNPYPLSKEEGARCCDGCNMVVVEARIKNLYPNFGKPKVGN